MSATAPTLFFYGSLRENPLLAAVIGHGLDGIEMRPAKIPGFRAAAIPDRVYPALQEAVGRAVVGVAVFGLSADDIARLDAYEGKEFARHPIVLDVAGATVHAEVYRADIVVPADAPDWSYETFSATHGAQLDLTPGQSADDLRRQLEALRPESR